MNQNNESIDVSDVPNYKLKQGEAEKLERWLFWIGEDRRRKRRIRRMESVSSVTMLTNDSKNEKKMCVSRDPDDRPAVTKTPSQDVKESFNLEPISTEDAKIERKLLMKEYMEAQEVGRHLDLLRWNVSKFFLSIQTVFVIVAAKGLMELGKTYIPAKGALTGKVIIDKSLVTRGLVFLSAINIVLCVIWWWRNKGIHAWHRASITRQRLIELDPRLRQTVSFYSTILRRLPILAHGTGNLECWGPPLTFIVLWHGVTIFAARFSNKADWMKIWIPVLLVTFLSLFVVNRLYSKDTIHDIYTRTRDFFKKIE